MSERIKVGIVGCGNISQAYFNGCRLFPILEVTACADLNEAAARKKAEENQVRALTVAELMQDPDIQIVINLTVPRVHAEISLQALRAGKHVHSEKPLGVSLAEGRAVVEEAAARKLRAGCAPDTFLGAGFQTCRKLVEDGWIGRPLAGTAFMMGRGPEGWHPNPAFFYEAGGGPMFDMGPYYLTALVHLLGPVKSVSAVTTRGFEERIATCKEQMGRRLPVQVPTHYSGTLVFRDGAVVTVVVSFDVHRSAHRNIEVYGSDGSLQAPDPNTFGGPVSLFRPGSDDWMTSTLTHGYRENSRGIGVADMAHAVRSGRPHRCDARLALHVVEIMHAFEASSRTGQVRVLETTCERPAPLPLGLLPGVLDD
ncbi:MAG TPA: Gfo/Idh/MocA family oxidoreductase [Kiritimatiellia bacterium]|nr:Gfo/Idh/MocA family oxidoreductase [Kiritimatiellia bacterium]